MNNEREQLMSDAIGEAKNCIDRLDLEVYSNHGSIAELRSRGYIPEAEAVERLAKRQILANTLKNSRSTVNGAKYETRWNMIDFGSHIDEAERLDKGLEDTKKLLSELFPDTNNDVYNKIIDKLESQRDEFSHYWSQESAMEHMYPNSFVRGLRYLVGKLDEVTRLRKIGYVKC